ncbi:MAG: lipid hydroperoxide peroxidase [Acidobacteria bacterium RIFCSPLOWO2_02_FULL_59_13]|nr:MAG: lipid hydroperoxide peroxidase [Acidobacteria bacterium RIFCSPLOWO2_02_FULL_59_13]
MSERKGAVTLRGNPMTLVGPELKVGDKAPDFKLVGNDMKPVTLADTSGKVRIIACVPSLDTPVCDTETRRFNEEAGKLPGVDILTVSMDLPFAQSRWCGAAGVKNVRTLSDYQERSFGPAYGVLIKELQLEARAVFVVAQDNTIRYVQYVKEVGEPPDYEAALTAASKLA